MKRIFLIFLGLALLAGVSALGFYASVHPTYIIWFGLAAAFLVSPAILLFGQAIKNEASEPLIECRKRASVRDLLAKAETEEERIEILDEQMRKLDVTVRVASKRQSLAATVLRLEKELETRLSEYDSAVQALEELDSKIGRTTVREEVERARKMVEERERGRVIVLHFGRREYSFPVRTFGNDLISSLLLMILSGLEKMQTKKPNQKPLNLTDDLK